MGMLEILRSNHRINKAVREVAPRDIEEEILGNMVFLSTPYPFGREMADEYVSYSRGLKAEREELKDKIDFVHPEWHKHSPKENVIVDFLKS